MRTRQILLAAVSVLWLLYALWLDVRYARFPEVMLGAVQILLALYALLTLLWIARLAVARLVDRR